MDWPTSVQNVVTNRNYARDDTYITTIFKYGKVVHSLPATAAAWTGPLQSPHPPHSAVASPVPQVAAGWCQTRSECGTSPALLELICPLPEDSTKRCSQICSGCVTSPALLELIHPPPESTTGMHHHEYSRMTNKDNDSTETKVFLTDFIGAFLTSSSCVRRSTAVCSMNTACLSEATGQPVLWAVTGCCQTCTGCGTSLALLELIRLHPGNSTKRCCQMSEHMQHSEAFWFLGLKLLASTAKCRRLVSDSTQAAVQLQLCLHQHSCTLKHSNEQ